MNYKLRTTTQTVSIITTISCVFNEQLGIAFVVDKFFLQIFQLVITIVDDFQTQYVSCHHPFPSFNHFLRAIRQPAVFSILSMLYEFS